MALRFRRSIKIAPGLRINLGKRGVSMSTGPRGASMTYGRGGLYGNVGMPGSGLSYRKKLKANSKASRTAAQPMTQETSTSVKISLDEDGSVELLDSNDLPLSSSQVKMVKEQLNDTIKEWLDENCENWNKGIDAIQNLHIDTPPADLKVNYQPVEFDVPPPQKPSPKSAGFWGAIFKGKQRKIDAENLMAQQAYTAKIKEWKDQHAEHKKREAERQMLIEKTRFNAPEGMQDFFAEVLSDIEWPRETLVSYEVSDSGKEIYLDIDLPEIEDMPTEYATVAARGFKLNIKKKSDTQCRKEYMAHIHAILFRIIGEAFVALPTVDNVIASGYSQRPDKKTGQINDEYLLSVKVERQQWETINFSNLAALDLTECLAAFSLNRKMTKTGVFSAISPHEKGC